ncbi:thiamine-phosphate kinase [Tunturiibacter empetritectus]|uniref:Thiamine-monophosphate kinase n=2 Tax=Tunturiibacter TaxID=3154218 RepID=A0A852VBI6_9BACT|nr:thiamine-monophosphate kinase [Edaphobacter lichenicola]
MLNVYAAISMKKPSPPFGELDLIEQIRQDFATSSSAVKLGIGDDCAILRPPPGCEVLVTTDLTLEGRHFRCDSHPPESVGHRCLARGLSDLAAMGATPIAAFLSLALPSTMLTKSAGRAWTKGFFHGLRALAELHSVPLAGGDTSESPGGRSALILADIVLIGSAPKGRALRRSGASPGDALYVTGQLGGAAAELATMLSRRRRTLNHQTNEDHPHMFPEPRLDVGEALQRRGLATACLDISDGLSTDLSHLCRASGVSAEIEQEALPIHPFARKLNAAAALQATLHGGEDYELLFAAPSSVKMPSTLAGVPLTRIGTLKTRRTGHALMTLLAPDGSRTELKPGGWEHFSKPASKSKKA